MQQLFGGALITGHAQQHGIDEAAETIVELAEGRFVSPSNSFEVIRVVLVTVSGQFHEPITSLPEPR